ncbi:MAG TPA: disulfide bond formation protein B [Gammaproteobacteria bacterium]|nr:disulfide bond formation protein B [Gammaproteobacteria bacterium]
METEVTDQAKATSWWLIFICWLISMLSTLGSLFFSEIMDLIPCELCWYQRIFMFPLTIILLLGLHPLDARVVRYALPIAGIGLLFTIYHSLLFYGLIPENLQPCRQGISCADDSMVLFGVLPIPLLSLAAFITIIVLLIKAHVLLSRNNESHINQPRNTT